MTNQVQRIDAALTVTAMELQALVGTRVKHDNPMTEYCPVCASHMCVWRYSHSRYRNEYKKAQEAEK